MPQHYTQHTLYKAHYNDAGSCCSSLQTHYCRLCNPSKSTLVLSLHLQHNRALRFPRLISLLGCSLPSSHPRQLISPSLPRSPSLNIDVSMEQPSRHIGFWFLHLSAPPAIWQEADWAAFLVVFVVTLERRVAVFPLETGGGGGLLVSRQWLKIDLERWQEEAVLFLICQLINSSSTRQDYSSPPHLSVALSHIHKQPHALYDGGVAVQGG